MDATIFLVINFLNCMDGSLQNLALLFVSSNRETSTECHVGFQCTVQALCFNVSLTKASYGETIRKRFTCRTEKKYTKKSEFPFDF